MLAQIVNSSLAFEGVLGEDTSLKHLTDTFETLKKSGFTPPLCIDLSKVRYANSTGLVTWLKFTTQVGVPIKFVNTPVWLVNQFNVIRGFFENGSYVESLEAPFFAPATKDSKNIVLQIGKDIPVLNDYSKFEMPNRTVDGKVYEIDFLPKKYLLFISDNYNMFKEKFK